MRSPLIARLAYASPIPPSRDPKRLFKSNLRLLYIKSIRKTYKNLFLREKALELLIEIRFMKKSIFIINTICLSGTMAAGCGNGLGVGTGMSVVGNWVPRINCPNLILHENTAALMPFLESASKPIGEVKIASKGDFPESENNELGEVAWLQAKVRAYGIEKKGTRNSQPTKHYEQQKIAARYRWLLIDYAENSRKREAA
jgi:hypothetical protein